MLFKRKAVLAEDLRPLLRCSFCNKSDRDVQKLVAGPSVFICDECIAVCNDILARDKGETAAAAPAPVVQDAPATGLTLQCGLCGMPVLYEEALPIAERGVLCPGCTGDVELAIDGRRDGTS